VTVDVPLVRTFGAIDVDGEGFDVAAVVRDASGDRVASAVEESFSMMR
jgi:hypothetical protein